ncbi:MAG TPA: MarR family transcriptional regulator [Thermoanaerobaculia bacterium]|nr:MarR family transcriptional regulator [Thermoanaerobaculia bacterium]
MARPLRYLSPVHKAGRQIGLWLEKEMAGSGLVPQEGHILTYLRRYAPCPVGELVTVFGLRGSTATSVLDRLEERGFIARRDNPDDRRSFLVDLTAEGKRIANHVQEFVDRIEAAIAKRVTTDEDRGFNAVMAAIAAATDVNLVAGAEAAKKRKKRT